MSRSLVAGALVLGLGALFGFGCEKQPPGAEAPAGPTVIVEDPGAKPTPAPDDAGSEAGSEAGAETGDPDDFGKLETVATDVPCKSDADCVKSPCCHATTCVAIADAPDCAGAICTLECRAGTTDCYGGCVCQAGQCAAQIWSPPEQKL